MKIFRIVGLLIIALASLAACKLPSSLIDAGEGPVLTTRPPSVAQAQQKQDEQGNIEATVRGAVHSLPRPALTRDEAAMDVWAQTRMILGWCENTNNLGLAQRLGRLGGNNPDDEDLQQMNAIVACANAYNGATRGHDGNEYIWSVIGSTKMGPYGGWSFLGIAVEISARDRNNGAVAKRPLTVIAGTLAELDRHPQQSASRLTGGPMALLVDASRQQVIEAAARGDLLSLRPVWIYTQPGDNGWQLADDTQPSRSQLATALLVNGTFRQVLRKQGLFEDIRRDLERSRFPGGVPRFN